MKQKQLYMAVDKTAMFDEYNCVLLCYEPYLDAKGFWYCEFNDPEFNGRWIVPNVFDLKPGEIIQVNLSVVKKYVATPT